MRGAELIMAELASILAKAWPELLLGVIILYACIALLLIVLVFIGGRLQARIKTAIERLTAMIAELAERSADMTQSKSTDADSTEIINAIERLSIKIDQLTEHPVAAAQPEGHAPIGTEASAAIERLTDRIEQLAARPAETSKNASHHYTLDEIKAAIGVLTSTVEHLIANVQQMQSQTLEITAETSLQGEIRQELRDLLKELE
jgi:DNA repair exonuclease SbcCD ATPase subunit